MSKRAASNDSKGDEKIAHTLKIDNVDEENGSGPAASYGGAKLDATFINYKSNSKKADLATPLAETTAARLKIPRLNEDVQGYIVSFLSGFNSLHVASQIARGFRLRAKPRFDAMLKRSDADIKVAAKAWCEDAEAAREIYGPISIWNTSEVASMSSLFGGDSHGVGPAAKQFNEDISRWDVSNVTTMEGMFHKASSFNGDLSLWNVSNVTTMKWTFYGAEAFKGDLSSWNVSNVTDMQQMFQEASSFNGDLSSWDVDSVENMMYMFSHATSFNCDLSTWSSWNWTSVEQEDKSNYGMLQGASSFDQAAIYNWTEQGKLMTVNPNFNPN
ncbi:hypothetical protein TrST_g2079 [Triparma strigata]|uniref:BspA family leucine-rich repeat surface protein n=1 Tax=Triparma strigata TaxID=1606541 RepID=A0A9W7E653_9STRA|nr:hypothetical protein TrST_g2079 [Triparma strigata]